MARPCCFKREASLDKAMHLFWHQGYEATSLDDLTKVMGINKSSFYNSYKSKRELFIESLEHYKKTVGGVLVERMRNEPTPDKAIRALFDAFIDVGDNCGCLLGNTANQMANDSGIMSCTEEGINILIDEFERHIRLGQKKKIFSSKHKARTMAKFLISNMQGLLILAKTGKDNSVLNSTVDIIMDGLKAK